MFFTNERVMGYSLAALGILLWILLWRVFAGISYELEIPQGLATIPYLQQPITLNFVFGIVAFVISAAAVGFTWQNSKAREFGTEVVVETKKVSWPSRKELQGSTLVVILMVLLVTVIIFGFDKVFDFALKLLFRR